MTTYWTMGEDGEFPAVTLCEEHALEATNIAASLWGMGPWDSMGLAALELETLTAIFGQGQEIVAGFGFTTSEEGHCDECKHPSGAIVIVTEESA
jgi:hypothetical protein